MAVRIVAMAETIRILGVDPGLRRTGWGLIAVTGNSLAFVAAGTVKAPLDGELAHRLVALHRGLSEIVAGFRPDEAAVEQTFVNRDAAATLKLGQARGAILLAPARLGLRVAEYTPNLIKKSVTGTGHAEKQQIQAMISFLLPKATFESADEADALAIAITHAHLRASEARTGISAAAWGRRR